MWHKLLVHFKYSIKPSRVGIDTRLVVSVDARRPYLFVGNKSRSNQKNPHIFVYNKINCLSFTAFKNFKLELMETFQFLQTRVFRNECKPISKKKKGILTLAVLTIACHSLDSCSLRFTSVFKITPVSL